MVGQATHPSMPHCPPPPQCDPTHEKLVAPLEPGIADVGLVFLERAPSGIRPARSARPGALERFEGRRPRSWDYGTAEPAVPLGDTSAWDGRRRVRTSRSGKVVDETSGLLGDPQLRLPR